jgi:hypothetical protein
MPKDFLVQAAQAYIVQPRIHIGYNTSKGGLGTVRAIVIEHPIDIAQATSSTTKRKRLDVQSSRIQLKILKLELFKEFCLQFQGWCLVLHGRHFRRLV